MIGMKLATLLQSILDALGGALSTALAPSASWDASTVTVSSSAEAAIGAGTTWNGGIMLTNLDAAIVIYVSHVSSGTAAAATRTSLIPGINPTVIIPVADAAGIFVKAASGSPLLGVVAAS